MDPKLTIELVPKTCWYSNVRSMVSPSDWNSLRKECYQQANYKCEICGGIGPKWPVEAHEIWHYDADNLIQKLERLISLCPSCHQVKHIGYAQVSGKGDEALQHLMSVNEWTETWAMDYVYDQFGIWRDRSIKNWEVDLRWLENKGIGYERDR